MRADVLRRREQMKGKKQGETLVHVPHVLLPCLAISLLYFFHSFFSFFLDSQMRGVLAVYRDCIISIFLIFVRVKTFLLATFWLNIFLFFVFLLEKRKRRAHLSKTTRCEVPSGHTRVSWTRALYSSFLHRKEKKKETCKSFLFGFVERIQDQHLVDFIFFRARCKFHFSSFGFVC